mmetsp:Transcript_8449/g.17535  ORF Transcript_8449/g.17535 Transcript_8449/m.17535 type:complete len:127 (+) Transcript_8449:139-519(+)
MLLPRGLRLGHQPNIRLGLCGGYQTTAASIVASSSTAYRSTAHRCSVVSNDSLAQLSTDKVFPTQISAPSALRGSTIATFTPKQGDVPNFLSRPPRKRNFFSVLSGSASMLLGEAGSAVSEERPSA